MSQSDLRVHVGLGRETVVTALEVRWANGPTTRYAIPKVDAAYTIDQKTGAVARPRPDRPNVHLAGRGNLPP